MGQILLVVVRITVQMRIFRRTNGMIANLKTTDVGYVYSLIEQLDGSLEAGEFHHSVRDLSGPQG